MLTIIEKWVDSIPIRCCVHSMRKASVEENAQVLQGDRFRFKVKIKIRVQSRYKGGFKLTAIPILQPREGSEDLITTCFKQTPIPSTAKAGGCS